MVRVIDLGAQVGADQPVKIDVTALRQRLDPEFEQRVDLLGSVEAQQSEFVIALAGLQTRLTAVLLKVDVLLPYPQNTNAE